MAKAGLPIAAIAAPGAQMGKGVVLTASGM